jgi:thiol:disulfide interchange protein DsbD
MVDFDPGHPELSALLLGIIYGATFCTLTCSPFIASYIIGSDRGTRRGVWLSVIFNGGRVVTYGLLGLAVGLAGGAFLVEGVYALWGAIFFGIAVALIGIWIAVRRRPGSACACTKEASWAQRLWHRVEPREGDGGELSAAGMGLLIGLVPCPPLIALLVFSAAVGSAATGLVLGLLFGIGTVISPIIIIAAAAGWFSERIAMEAPAMRTGIRRVAGVMLVLLGIWTAWNALAAVGVVA